MQTVTAQSELPGAGAESRVDVAVIADDADQGRLIERLLHRCDLSVAVGRSAADAEGAFRQHTPKVVLCDYELPDGDGIGLCKALRRGPQGSSAYFLLMSASECQTLVTQALDAGADDFLRKPLARDELVARVRVGLRMWRLHDQLRKAATTDGLTGLANYDHFHRSLAAELARSRRYGRPLSLILIDLDFFKAVNDTYGHPAGNAVLQGVARILGECVRECDLLGRLGGEEFGILLPESRTADAVAVAERARIGVRESLCVPDIEGHPLTISLGVADSEDSRVHSAVQLVDLADRALYAAKRQGRNRVSTAEELDGTPAWSQDIQSDEVEALRRRLAVLSARAKDVYLQSVAALLQALNEKDPVTARHTLNVAFYAQQIAEHLRCSPSTIRSAYNAALLHDVGKVGIPDRILMKTTALTEIERQVLGQVPVIGARIVDHLRILEGEIQIIRHQRESFDGSGTPSGLAGTRIPIGSRILLVADAFDSMTTDRVYRGRRPIDEALAELHRGSGTQFDPAVVMALDALMLRNRALWQQRIDETVRAMRLPGELVFGRS